MPQNGRNGDTTYVSSRRITLVAALVVVLFAVSAAGVFSLHRASAQSPATTRTNPAPVTSPVSTAASSVLGIPSATKPAAVASRPTSQETAKSSSTATPGTAEANAARPPAQTQAADAPLQNPLVPRGELIVQVAAFADEANARKLAESLRQRNFPAFLSIDATGGVYRVQVGPYTDEASARIARSELERAGFEPFIRH